MDRFWFTHRYWVGCRVFRFPIAKLVPVRSNAIQSTASCHWRSYNSVCTSSVPLIARHEHAVRFGWGGLVAPIAFLIMLSAASCILTCALRLLPLAFIWHLIFITAAIVIVYVIVRSLTNAMGWYEFVEWPVIESMLALSFGGWLILRGDRSVKAATRT